MIGDFGVGVKQATRRRAGSSRSPTRCGARSTRDDVRLILTTGDNIYAGTQSLGIPIGGTGDEDDDWFFTYFQPYRYVINRIPVYPSIGNHDADETEERDDRAQVEDNFYLRERIAGEEAAGRASFGPGLFYRFRYGSDIEFVCLDTSKEGFFRGHRLFEYPEALGVRRVRRSRPTAAASGGGSRSAITRPSAPGRSTTTRTSMERLSRCSQRAGVKALFSGHEHNFQHSRADGIDYFVTGAGGKLRRTPPDRFEEAHTVTWAPMPLSAGDDHGRHDARSRDWRGRCGRRDPVDITRLDPRGPPHVGPMEILRA